MEQLPHDFVSAILSELMIRPKILSFLKTFELDEPTTQHAFLRDIIRLYLSRQQRDERDALLVLLNARYPLIRSTAFEGRTAIGYIEDAVGDLLSARIRY